MGVRGSMQQGGAGQGDGAHSRREGTGCARLHHTTQNSAQCKAHELFISGMFHLIYFDLG